MKGTMLGHLEPQQSPNPIGCYEGLEAMIGRSRHCRPFHDVTMDCERFLRL